MTAMIRVLFDHCQFATRSRKGGKPNQVDEFGWVPVCLVDSMSNERSRGQAFSILLSTAPVECQLCVSTRASSEFA